MPPTITKEACLLDRIRVTPSAEATQNACKLCAPLGAALVFKGIQGAVPLLHGSQGCSTYIRRYLISHYKEPIDIACSNFSEHSAIFGGGANLKLALENVRHQYAPSLVGIATTCLSETIGDDVAMFIKEYRRSKTGQTLPPIVHVSTPSYQGSHMEGFHRAVWATVSALAGDERRGDARRVNLFPGMLSPADIRHLKQMTAAFGLEAVVLPDYSETLDGGLWKDYQRVPEGGTPVDAIAAAGAAEASIELGGSLAMARETAASFLQQRFAVRPFRLGMPIGIRQTDVLIQSLAEISGRPVPGCYAEQRGRLLDTLVDGHKYVNTVRAALYGEEDLVAGMAGFLAEIGIHPVVCASGGRSMHLAEAIRAQIPASWHAETAILEDADFTAIETAVDTARPDLIIGHSKGYAMSRRLGIPLVRIGFPIHDRMGGSRLLHVGYEGAMALFDRLANTLIERRQDASPIGYTYM
ncbi:nitrogenase component 1 [Desulfatitalea tepidiphila]|uniref:nitrogenase component 1 n=1 Tax=Desulfatitalea tepidiphila TaxID=1185843 RepID=UPI00097657F5|nr:nitrogenase component 1 [Desulfatitalea tepidiphila]